jgi:hypothetical protein
VVCIGCIIVCIIVSYFIALDPRQKPTRKIHFKPSSESSSWLQRCFYTLEFAWWWRKPVEFSSWPRLDRLSSFGTPVNLVHSFHSSPSLLESQEVGFSLSLWASFPGAALGAGGDLSAQRLEQAKHQQLQQTNNAVLLPGFRLKWTQFLSFVAFGGIVSGYCQHYVYGEQLDGTNKNGRPLEHLYTWR